MTGHTQMMNMASCNRAMDISYYMSEASQVILDDIYLHGQMHTWQVHTYSCIQIHTYIWIK